MLNRNILKEKWSEIPKPIKPYLFVLLFGFAIRNPIYDFGDRPFLLYIIILACYTAALPIVSWESNLSGGKRAWHLFWAFVFLIASTLVIILVLNVWKLTKW